MIGVMRGERPATSDEAVEWLNREGAAIELRDPRDRDDGPAWYIAKQDGCYYITTGASCVRNMSELMPENEIESEIRQGYTDRLRLEEAPMGDLIHHSP